MNDRPRAADTRFILAHALRTPLAHTAAAHTVGRCVVFAALSAPLDAQDSVVVVPDAPTCATCSLTVSAVVELGDREGPGIVAQLNTPYAQARVVRSDDGDYNGLSSWREGVGHPLHVYDVASRRITSSFGDDGVRVDRSRRNPAGHLRRAVAAAADGNIWAARENRYRIDKWSPDGDRIARIERDASWFRPWEEWPGVDYAVKPLPVIVGVRDWGDGLLMVVVRLADANWRPIRPTRTPLPGHETIEPTQQDELYDTVIEVLDTRSGTVLARTRVDEKVVGLVGRDGFCSYAEHSDLGEPKYVVWSVALSEHDR